MVLEQGGVAAGVPRGGQQRGVGGLDRLTVAVGEKEAEAGELGDQRLRQGAAAKRERWVAVASHGKGGQVGIGGHDRAKVGGAVPEKRDGVGQGPPVQKEAEPLAAAVGIGDNQEIGHGRDRSFCGE